MNEEQFEEMMCDVFDMINTTYNQEWNEKLQNKLQDTWGMILENEGKKLF